MVTEGLYLLGVLRWAEPHPILGCDEYAKQKLLQDLTSYQACKGLAVCPRGDKHLLDIVMRNLTCTVEAFV